MEGDGYKTYLDMADIYSPYTLFTWACRRGPEIVDPNMHDQYGKVVRYAASLGLGIALEVDIRMAREAFRAAYPGDQQRELVLKMADASEKRFAEVVFEGKDTSDHMTGSHPKYECLATRLVRIYSFVQRPNGIDPSTVRDITSDGVATSSERRNLTVRVPVRQGHRVCVIAEHEVLTPDVFSPHLLEYQRMIIAQYADMPLAGIMKDEWGFPMDPTGNPEHNRYWYSAPMAVAYAQISGGRDLIRDTLLMFAGERGRERERQFAINCYRKLCRTRNVEVENDFYLAGKEAFGPDAFIAAHATWFPYPGAQEFRKNGLSWWDATRDVGQTDETTPYACRTSLAKRWGYPLWYNQTYFRTAEPYTKEVWKAALSGGRLNVHPLYPRPDLSHSECRLQPMRSGLMAAMTRLRMLDFITEAPLNCPVAVIFGHAAAMNWAQPSYNTVGLEIASELSAQGYLVDLIPSSLVESKALKIDINGYVCLGPQQYRAVVLYQPEFGDQNELDFFSRAAVSGKSVLFQVGSWTKDFDANPLNAEEKLGASIRRYADSATCSKALEIWLANAAVPRVTGWSSKSRRAGHSGEPLAAPPTEGHTSLTDGTYVRIAGTENPEGDRINETFTWQGHTVTVDAVGVVAIRFAPDGTVAAFAAGGLKSIQTSGLKIVLPERIDLAFWTEENGAVSGVVQGFSGKKLPAMLQSITADWKRVSVPSSSPIPVL
jgi:hypothetical protein